MSDPRLLRGAPVRKRILDDVRAYVSAQDRMGKLVSVSIGDIPEVAVYVRNQARVARDVDLPFDQEYWGAMYRNGGMEQNFIGL